MKNKNNVFFIITKFIILIVAFIDWLPTEQEWIDGLAEIENSFPNTIWIDKEKNIKILRMGGGSYVLKRQDNDIQYPQYMNGIIYNKTFVITRNRNNRYFTYDVINNKKKEIKKHDIQKFKNKYNLKSDFLPLA
ncbi:hypothetical protein BHU61_02990 [Macrococcus epidermidis]|uniref:Uncharacterized protein n=1 Tax=Macrococcus epidermidis TaxID=1902580 RepID=A0A327ZW45_9STAP|nr:hypothetical protein [Macrococcus epidermidis]RAK46435.1 hypothetical protein BHU61_02990 [Macrococcus epidermidis]